MRKIAVPPTRHHQYRHMNLCLPPRGIQRTWQNLRRKIWSVLSCLHDSSTSNSFSTYLCMYLPLDPGIQKTNPDPSIRYPSPVTHPQRWHDRHNVLRHCQVLSHKEQSNRGKCPSLDHTRHTLAKFPAPRHLRRNISFEPHHCLRVYMRCRRCQ